MSVTVWILRTWPRTLGTAIYLAKGPHLLDDAELWGRSRFHSRILGLRERLVVLLELLDFGLEEGLGIVGGLG